MLKHVNAGEFFQMMIEIIRSSLLPNAESCRVEVIFFPGVFIIIHENILTPFLALGLKQEVHGAACPKYASSEHRLTIGIQLSAVMVEADVDPAKIPTPDLMEELHLSPDSMRETNCDFTVQEFHF